MGSILNPGLLCPPESGYDVAVTTTEPVATIGKQIQADGNTYEYVHANGAIAAYAACAIDKDGEATELTTAISAARPTSVGVAQVAFADNAYGWLVRMGRNFSVKGAASDVADTKQYTTATAGVVDDAATDLIQGLTITATLTGAGTVAAHAVTLMCTNCQD